MKSALATAVSHSSYQTQHIYHESRSKMTYFIPTMGYHFLPELNLGKSHFIC